MKILELRFKNLNSLYGEWFIDFSVPEYTSNSIFALTGPTGAGKSTILDAICLALYGATPRLGKITKSANEIMARQTGDCYAAVLFESQAGRFRCHWGQHRANKRADRPLQDSRHEISDAHTGKPIETKKSLVAGVIEEKTGMDFDRFTRSILLAQGGFDTFLKADAEQKSKILEQITGTEIYSQISRRVHERQRDEREMLNLLQAETSGILILEREQESAYQSDLEEKKKQEYTLAAKTIQSGKAIAWLTGIDGLQREISSLTEEKERLQTEIEAFQPHRERLDRAVKAAELDGDYATLTAVRKQQATDQSSLKTEEDKLFQLQDSSLQQAETLKAAEQQTIGAKKELRQAASRMLEVRSLDQKIAAQKVAISDAEESCGKDAAKINSDIQLKLKEQIKCDEASNNLQIIGQYLKEHARDEWLVSGLAGVEEQLSSLLSRQLEINHCRAGEKNAKTTYQQAVKTLAGCIKQCRKGKQEVEEAVASLEQEKKVLGELLGDRLLREYRMEKESLLREMAFLVKITELENLRAKLEDGKPCPLCGSEEHPFAEGNVPVPDQTEKRIAVLSELIRQAEDQEVAIKKLEKAESEARKKLAENEKLETVAVSHRQTAEAKLSELTYRLNIERAGFEELKRAVSAKLQPLGFEDIADSDISSIRQSLQDRLKRWQNQVKNKTQIERLIAALSGELKRLDAIIDTQRTALAEKRKALECIQKAYAGDIAQRRELYGDKNPDSEEFRLNKAIAEAELQEKKARDLHAEAQRKLHTTRTKAAALKERIEQRKDELKKLEEAFVFSLQRSGFTGENAFIEARLAARERDWLTAKAKGLSDRQTDLLARKKDRENRLAVESAKKITEKSLEELVPQCKEFEENLSQLRDTLASLKHRLSENMAAKERIKEKQAAIEAQKKECLRWEKLHGLIGSADGKKYRNFAQGLTFALMVSHANRQLEKMTDRYLLIRDEQLPLELNVIDNYQGGEIRSTKNLSGGESFIVSLSLALGLSKMASRKVRVDSLFLDEGFGTLDEEALDTALEALSGLQQDGKLIGIISHVSALRERISTQISITPVSGGKSTITGPGCYRVTARTD